VSGVLAWATLAGCLAAIPAGRRIGQHLRWMRAWAAEHHRHAAESDAAWHAELAALRAQRAAAQTVRDQQAARNAARARQLRPWAQPLGERAPMSDVTVASCDLRRVLRDVLPFTGRDENVALDSVCLEASGGTFSATATDRYTLGHSRATCTGEFGQRAVITRHAARAIKRMLPCGPTPHAFDQKVALSVEGNALRLRTGTADSRSELNLLVPLSLVTFPEYTAILTKFTDDTPGRPLGFTPHFLARFAKIGERYERPLRVFTHDPTSPVFVEVGDTFVGVTMPVRLPESLTGPTVPIGHAAAVPAPVEVPA
jgi:hypothetical protein